MRLAVLDGHRHQLGSLGAARIAARSGAPGDGRRQASRGGEAGAAGQAGARRGRHAARSGARRGGGRARARRSTACSRPRPAPERERREQADHDQAESHEAAPVDRRRRCAPTHQHQDGRAGHDPAQCSLRRLDARAARGVAAAALPSPIRRRSARRRFCRWICSPRYAFRSVGSTSACRVDIAPTAAGRGPRRPPRSRRRAARRGSSARRPSSRFRSSEVGREFAEPTYSDARVGDHDLGVDGGVRDGARTVAARRGQPREGGCPRAAAPARHERDGDAPRRARRHAATIAGSIGLLGLDRRANARPAR